MADESPIVGQWGLEWSAVLSTADVDARDNTDTNPLNPETNVNVPIYRIDGMLFSSSYTRLWNGFEGEFTAPEVHELNINELGELIEPPAPFTLPSGEMIFQRAQAWLASDSYGQADGSMGQSRTGS